MKTLKELRKEQRYTVKAVSEGTGIPFPTLTAYDNQYRSPSLRNAKKIADFFGVTVEEIDFKAKARKAKGE